MAMEMSPTKCHKETRDNVILDEATQRGPILGHEVLRVSGHYREQVDTGVNENYTVHTYIHTYLPIL